jgi:hypothetical protein
MPNIKIPTVYRGYTRRETSIDVEGETLGACLDAAEAIFPGFRALIVASDGSTHKFNKIVVDGEVLGRSPSILDRAVSANAQIEVLAALAGG